MRVGVGYRNRCRAVNFVHSNTPGVLRNGIELTVPEILDIVGPADVLLLEKWPSLLLVERKATFRFRRLRLPCCDALYILLCRGIPAGQYSPALFVRWKG